MTKQELLYRGSRQEKIHAWIGGVVVTTMIVGIVWFAIVVATR